MHDFSRDPRCKAKRIIGVDYGLKRFGLAISDQSLTIASPLEAWPTRSKLHDTVIALIEHLNSLAQEYKCCIEEIVMGIPLMMNGKRGVIADEVEHCIALIEQHSPLRVHRWDERLSTVQAERSLREGSLSRKKRSRLVDQVSAAILLQSYLDALSLARRLPLDTSREIDYTP